MLPELFDLYKLWYKLEDVNQIDLKPRGRDKVKIIPFNLLEKYINQYSLAHWFMHE